MDQLTEQQLDTHVKILGWLNVAGGIFFLLIGGFVFILLSVIGVASGDAEAMTVLPIIATFVGGVMFLMALPSLAAGYGLLKRRSWGRILAIIVGAFNLMNFPLGTAIGIYTFYVLFQESAGDYFASLKAA